MRLVAILLTAALAASAQQGPGKLPWASAPSPPWKAGDCGPIPTPAPVPPAGGSLQVRIAADGVLRVVDGRGMIRLRLGLPGRPLRAWRDGGRPLPDLAETFAFGTEPPLAKGLGALPVGAPDFRAALEGLLWILCDDGRTLTVVLPATSRVAYLPLPSAEGRELTFQPDRLEIREPGAGCWSLPWLTLLPQFIQLGQAGPARSTGTALVPFPRD